ncbi:MAG: MBL fold metallo-hydrolase [Candidatus Thermoplasmatota archaeon]|nr:MBL fold metallo-hydrolase [Euryarchaeota archaeon]MBU4031917.1 MBL fold metallo-hydrolase [Candidatus Thermoplasmatota archaeon]MBU4072193.1 MBL fold metallo-hydrolase [Candidatus Thermoplasmatota archaeon]MBU4145005.1 MBL fold metallo-hydrolase [Candidatus Thermoplasmatota archaeon]MBU4592019.1 MBL fold metallo-hydrolase [Candidatus Thermoplasmatota archaeon]
MMVHAIVGRGFSGNIFLVDAEKPCLIDTGWSPSIAYSARTMNECLNGRTLSSIILTHRHIDHVGGALAFMERFGGEILAHEIDAPPLIDGDQESTGAVMFGGELFPMPVRKLVGGEDIDLGGGEALRVIHTPGHTSGSMCLLGQGCLFSGDTVFADGGVGRWDLETGNYEELVASAEKLADMEFENLYPGHGPSVIGPAKEHVEMSLRHLKMIGRFG